MLEEKVEDQGSTPDDVIEDSSLSEDTQIEEATSQEATEKEPPFHEHPRFQELIAEKNELKEENKQLQQRMYETLEKMQTPTQETAKEQLFTANTPEEKQFWQQVINIAEKKAEERFSARERQYEQRIKASEKMTGNLIVKNFLKAHPDLKKSSVEMKEITQKAYSLAQTGMDVTDALEDSYKVVMFDKVQDQRVVQAKQQKQQKLVEKARANVETTSIPQGTMQPGKDSLEDVFDETAKDMGFSF